MIKKLRERQLRKKIILIQSKKDVYECEKNACFFHEFINSQLLLSARLGLNLKKMSGALLNFGAKNASTYTIISFFAIITDLYHISLLQST